MTNNVVIEANLTVLELQSGRELWLTPGQFAELLPTLIIAVDRIFTAGVHSCVVRASGVTREEEGADRPG